MLDETTLERSCVVANCAMNRERELHGSNGYDRELGLDPLATLVEASRHARHVRWLDLCCGRGRALQQAHRQLVELSLTRRLEIVGVDLVDTFERPTKAEGLTLIEASLSNWGTRQRFELITCVHGLHYIGDKLGLLRRAARWLTPTGRLVASFDPDGVRLEDGRPARSVVLASVRRAGGAFKGRQRRLTIPGGARLEFPLEFLGADDTAGSNYTGQPAVASYYRKHAPG